ncbi:MAG: radical SAM protein [Bacteroidales bacterium]|nr:radical SAM protein [Bacteroidales bacterium]
MKTDFSWVDEYFQNIKPYIFVRTEDNMLIKRPNEVQKLNKTGTLILKELLNGVKIQSILKKLNKDPEKILQVHYFLNAIRESVDGHTSIYSENPAVHKKPFDLQFSLFPILSELAVTYRCNLKCGFCYAGCNLTHNPINSDKELTTMELKLIIHKIWNQAKVPSISFTGGEPLLRGDLPELIKFAKECDMRVNLITNGTLITPEKVRSLVDAGLDSAQISLEGVDAETHDSLVGKKGAFQLTLNAVKLLKTTGIHVHTNTTLNRHNIEQAFYFPAFIKHEFGLKKFSMNMMIPSGSADKNNDLTLKYSEIGHYIDGVIAQSKNFGVEFMWYSPLPLCIYNTITHGLGNKGCSACDGLISVAPNGDILPCASFDKPVGNLLEKNFDDIWQDTDACFFRKKDFAPEYCRQCEHFKLCNGACPLYWRSIGFDELNCIINQNIF